MHSKLTQKKNMNAHACTCMERPRNRRGNCTGVAVTVAEASKAVGGGGGGHWPFDSVCRHYKWSLHVRFSWTRQRFFTALHTGLLAPRQDKWEVMESPTLLFIFIKMYIYILINFTFSIFAAVQKICFLKNTDKWWGQAFDREIPTNKILIWVFCISIKIKIIF